MCGYRVDPPRRHQPHLGLASRISAPDQPTLPPTAITTRLVSALVVMGLYFGASAPLNRPVQWGLELAFDTGCVIRTEQATGPFDRSRLSVPSREVYERSAAGTSQVSRRSVGGQRKLTPHRPARSWFIRGRSLHSAAHVQAKQAQAAARRGQSKAIPLYQQGSRECLGDPVGHAWARPSIHQ
jgi:hypothetical protein